MFERNYHNNRRLYMRIDVNSECVVFKDDVEMNAFIVDVSEDGMKISIRVPDMKVGLKVNDRMEVVGVDEDDVTCFCAEIVRVNEVGNNVILGARILNQRAIEPYVTKKKVDSFIEKLGNEPIF